MQRFSIGKFSLLLVAALCLLLPAVPSHAATLGIGIEAGGGVKHNEDSHGLFVRMVWLGETGGGCGIILGAWDGVYENDVAGVTCEKRMGPGNGDRPLVSAGVGVVSLDRSRIVNSEWAAEIHLRFFLARHLALGVSHFSNAGTSRPNRGFNFLSLELVF